MKLATFSPRFIRVASRLAAASLLAFATQLLTTSTAEAQQAGVIAGTVLGAGGQPLPGAQVRVTGTALGATTDASGRFRIVGLSGNQAAIEVRRIGYRMENRQVRVGDANLRVSLAEQSVALDAVVVTGTAGGQSKRELGNAVSTINAAQIKEIAPVNSVQNLLNGRAPGVVVQSATGNVGTGARIRIRGASSMALSNEPLIYVDGVRVNNIPATGFANQDFGSASISRINDFNPDDIESIEIIKGPAAATLYGTEASNGVIQIITKKGTTGAPRWSLATRLGTNYLRNPEGRWPVNYGTIPRVGGSATAQDTVSIDIIELENARGTPVFKSGPLREFDLSASGGSNIFTYFAGAGIEDSEGIEPTSSVKRYSSRLNVAIVPNAKFKVSANVGYMTGETHLPCEGGCGGRTLSTMWANVRNNVPLADGSPNPRRGFHTARPDMYDRFVQIWQGVNRFTGGVQMNHEPFGWFKHRLSAGTDRTTEDDNWLRPRAEDPFDRLFFTNGYRAVQTRQLNYYTLDYAASGIFDVRPNIKSTTSVGAQYYRNTSTFQFSEGSVFPTVGLTALSATTIDRATSSDAEQDATLGFFVQQQLGFNDRLFLTAAVRADDNSAFGQNFDQVTYPKYSASWVVSEEPFWSFPLLNALKLRAAYGESGKQPITFSAVPAYLGVSGPGDVPAVTPAFLGNLDLGAERSKEIETGFDLGALDDRVGVEFSWYRKTTTDAILNRQLAPSIGLPGTQPFNAGKIRNSGMELMLRTTPIQSDRIELDVTFGIATNDSEILDLSTPPEILALRQLSGTPDFVSAGGFIRHQVGYPIGAYFDQRTVSAVLLPNGTPDVSQVLCDNGKGGTMICAGPDLRYGNADDAPEVFLGKSSPGTEGAFSSTLSLWKRFRVYGLIDFKRDFVKLDGNFRARCAIFERCRENFYPNEFDPKVIAGLRSSGQLVDYYINNSGFAKLREVSFSYTLPAVSTRWAKFNRAVVTLAGRNLATWTDYPGLEPEAFFLGGSRGGQFGQWEQNAAPQLTSWVLGVNLDW